MEDNIFKFEDFLGKKEKLKSIKQILENIEEEPIDFLEGGLSDEEDIEDIALKHDVELEDIQDQLEKGSEVEMEHTDDSDIAKEIAKDHLSELPDYYDRLEDIESVSQVEGDKYYNLYSDKSENFVCDISIQGADPKQTEARLVVESGDWTLMFYGEVRNGKCTIPIKKLNILKEGQIGDIRLEVIAEGNLFIPWEDKFKVRVSKKVSVRVNEQKDYYSRPLKKNVGVKVKVKK